jgi:hypothetical protein
MIWALRKKPIDILQDDTPDPPQLRHLHRAKNRVAPVGAGSQRQQLRISWVLLHPLFLHGVDRSLQGVEILLPLRSRLAGLSPGSGRTRGRPLRSRRRRRVLRTNMGFSTSGISQLRSSRMFIVNYRDKLTRDLRIVQLNTCKCACSRYLHNLV